MPMPIYKRVSFYFALLMVLGFSGCQPYYFVAVRGVEPAELATLKAWVVKGPPEGLRLQIKNRGRDPLFVDWKRSKIVLPLYGKRRIVVKPRHDISFVARSSVFDLRPAGPKPVMPGAKSKRKIKDLFPSSLFKKNKRPKIQFQLVVCTGESASGALPTKCRKGSSSWRYLTGNATVSLRQKRSDSKRKRAGR